MAVIMKIIVPYNMIPYSVVGPITVAQRTKALTVFARWNPTERMVVCVCAYYSFVLLCV
jgi:hypothetical protein